MNKGEKLLSISILLILVAIFSILAIFIKYMITPNHAVLTPTNKTWFREIVTEYLDTNTVLESVYNPGNNGRIISTYQTTSTDMTLDMNGDIALETSTDTHYIYNPWMILETSRVDFGEVRWPSVLSHEGKIIRRSYRESYTVFIGDMPLSCTEAQFFVAEVGKPFDIEWSYGTIVSIKPHESELVNFNELDY